jgi:hypothetical protein
MYKEKIAQVFFVEKRVCNVGGSFKIKIMCDAP